MSERDSHVVRLYDKRGDLYGVLISPELWHRVERSVMPEFERVLEAMYPTETPEPLDDFKVFKDYWDFKYPYVADVHCGHCGVSVEDWEHDPEKTFRLRNATLSGMLVFTCTRCGASIRKKHFKDQIQFEFTPPPSGNSN